MMRTEGGLNLCPASRVPLVMRSCLQLILVVHALAVHATSTIHVSGRIVNWQEPYPGMGLSVIGIRSEGWLQPNAAPDPATGHFSGTLPCGPLRNAHGRWVDIEFYAFTDNGPGRRSMFIRVPYAKEIDLGEVIWRPTHYRLTPLGLVIDTGVPRDTVIGEPFGTYLLLRPMNPEPGERMELVFGYISSGEPRVVSHGIASKDLGTYLVNFNFALRTDTEVFTESWNEEVSPFDLGPLAGGRYRLRQSPSHVEHLRDIDFLLNEDLWITVAQRQEP